MTQITRRGFVPAAGFLFVMYPVETGDSSHRGSCHPHARCVNRALCDVSAPLLSAGITGIYSVVPAFSAYMPMIRDDSSSTVRPLPSSPI